LIRASCSGFPEIFVETAFGSTAGVAAGVAGVVAVGVDGVVVSPDFFDAPIALPDFGASIAFDAEALLFGAFVLTFGACALPFGACALPFGACALTFGAFVVDFGPAGVASDAVATESAAIVAIARNVFIWDSSGGRLHKKYACSADRSEPVFSVT
jgi:hypothetical protein